MKVRHLNRLRRNRVARAIRMRRNGNEWPRHYGTDGPECGHFCAPTVNGKLERATIMGNLHSQEIQQS